MASLTRAALSRALDDHCARVAACRRCALAPGVMPIVSRARAPRGILVGQAPGQTEMGGGQLFAGRAGRTLFKRLASAGIDESTARDWLAEELRIIRPRVLVPVGRLAIDRFFGPVPLAAVVGGEHEVEHEGGRSLAIPLPHPSGASSWIHAPGNRALLHRALALLGERLRPAGERSVA
ncbi:MAG: hypothetical protein LH467_10595 [Gemmatimonadaceae bacterium]|nr:hypothetical protein [Gemmatimonadaceae bacterium]